MRIVVKMEDDEDYSGLVFDNGACEIRVGRGGDDCPKHVVPTCIARPYLSPKSSTFYCGQEALNHRDVYELSQPIKNGVVEDWDAMEALWDESFRLLKMKPEDWSVLNTLPPFEEKKMAEKIAEIQFERFNIRGIYLAPQSSLACYAWGAHAGLIVHIGPQSQTVLPFYHYTFLEEALVQQHIGSDDLNAKLQEKLSSVLVHYPKNSETDSVENIKKDMDCLGKKDAVSPIGDVHYDTNDILDVFFNPRRLEMFHSSIQKLVFDSVQKCDISARKDLYRIVVLSGGGTLLKNFDERLKSELAKLIPESMEIRVIHAPERKSYPWIGGSIMACFCDSLQKWTTRETYLEKGASCLDFGLKYQIA